MPSSTTAAETSPALGSEDPRARRDALFEAHSVLRSTDNLRPDEAFDELVKLYSLWSVEGVVDFDSADRFDSSLTLSSGAFRRVASVLGPHFTATRIGGDLFQELVDVGVRAGLGQYFTPAPVARSMAAFLRPLAGERWLDPFCGSGLLLGTMAGWVEGPVSLFGIDRDSRVLRLAQVESTLHHPGSPVELLQANALGKRRALVDQLDGGAGFDGIVTNPPFGAEVHLSDRDTYEEFALAKENGTPLEVLGLEQSIRLLRPGGRLGIVVPQSILSNRGHRDVREFLMKACRIDGVLSLPPETFGPYKGVGKAAVLFATRHEVRLPAQPVVMGISRSVGWDSTGRTNGRSDVEDVAQRMGERAKSEAAMAIPPSADLLRNLTPEWHLRKVHKGRALGDLATAVFTGRTPGRAAYEAGTDAAKDTVYRVLKVGDLTGSGIDWSADERRWAVVSPKTSKLVRTGDIALTAAAHHPRYIGAKVDLTDDLPAGLENRVFPAAEVMVIRADPREVEPLALLLWLRSEAGYEAIQSCVTGQTAHLHPDYVREVVVPREILEADLTSAMESLKASHACLRQSEQLREQARKQYGDAIRVEDP